MTSRRSASKTAKFKRFHVLGSERCRYCTMLEGAIRMHLHSTAESTYNRHVSYHDIDTHEGKSSWDHEVGHAVPESYRTIPRVVAEFSDGSLQFVGGFDDFVKLLGCPKKD